MAPVVLAVVLAGCGASRTVTGGSQPGPQAGTTATSLPTPTTRRTAAPHSLQPLAGGTECVVSDMGAFVVFKSTAYDVSPACQTQIRAGAAVGQHWTYPTGGQVSGSSPVCTLATTMAMVTVYDTTDNIGRDACRGLLSQGWTAGASG